MEESKLCLINAVKEGSLIVKLSSFFCFSSVRPALVFSTIYGILIKMLLFNSRKLSKNRRKI